MAVPSFATPNKLELRPLQQALDNIREGLKQLDTRLAQVSLQAGQNTIVAGQSAGAASGTSALLAQLRTDLDALAALAAGVDALQLQPGPIIFIGDGEDGEDGMWMPSPLPALSVPLDATASRALDTTYTNTSAAILAVHLTVRCAVTLAGGNAYVQAKMDTASPPTVNASGLMGIQAGLLGEDNSFQLSFWVNPGGTYRVVSSALNGTVTLGRWFELPI